MFLRRNLRKGFGLGEVRFVAADAQLGGIQLCWLNGCGIIGMPGQRPMARLAANSLVHAFTFHGKNLAVTALAYLMSSVGDRKRCDLADCVAPVMSVLSKAPRHQKATDDQENGKSQ